MNSLLALFVGMLTATVGTNAQRSQPRPIFREVTFAPYDAIRLGEIPRGNSPAGQPRGGDRIVLSGFGNTDSITLQFDTAKRVVALHFAYPNSKDYAAFVADYLTSLGTPRSRATVDSAGGRRERILWEDSNTQFEIVRFSRQSRTVSFVAQLVDLQRRRR